MINIPIIAGKIKLKNHITVVDVNTIVSFTPYFENKKTAILPFITKSNKVKIGSMELTK